MMGFWLILLIYWLISSATAKENLHRERNIRNSIVRAVIIAILFALIYIEPVQEFSKQFQFIFSNPVVGTIGILLCGAGIAFAIWARVHLGKSWGMPMSLKDNPDLITTGPYRLVRHPIYGGGLCAVLGSVLTIHFSWLIIFIAACVYFIYCAKVEEAIMSEQFPDQYLAYKKRTKLLIPFIL